jgi:hypothetical protein
VKKLFILPKALSGLSTKQFACLSKAINILLFRNTNFYAILGVFSSLLVHKTRDKAQHTIALRPTQKPYRIELLFTYEMLLSSQFLQQTGGALFIDRVFF